MTHLKMKNGSVLSGTSQNKVVQLFFFPSLWIWRGKILPPNNLGLSEIF